MLESFSMEQVARHVGLGLVVIVVGDEILTAFSGKNSRISEYNCAASVLFGAMIAGRPWRAITWAMV
jgi:hypothetical protein